MADTQSGVRPIPWPAFECQFCTSPFHTLDEYLAHIEAHMTQFDLKHSCRTCKRQFAFRDELEQHTRLLHANLKPYKCKLCDQSFALVRSLEYHLRTHGASRIYRCDLCGTMFNELAELHEHLKDHQMGRVAEEEADDVSMSTMLEAAYPELELTTQSHEDEEEAEVKPPLGLATTTADGVKTETGATAAHYQFKSTNGSSSVGGAVGAVLDPHEDEEAIFARAVSVKKTFCNLCNKKMATRKSLNTHYKSVHMKNAHTCSVCRTSFLFSRLLEAHTRKRKRIIDCEFCENRFCSNKRWASHMERHQADSVSATPAGGMVVYPRAVPITSSSSRPMNSLSSANAIAVGQQQQMTTNSNGSNNNARQSLLKTNQSMFHAPQPPATITSTRGSAAQSTAHVVGNTIGKFPCDACGKIFMSLNYLQSHMVKRRNPNFAFQCDICEHRFSKKAILDEHKAFHERNPKKVPKLVINKNRVNGFAGEGNSSTNAAPSIQPTTRGSTTAEEEEMDYERHIIRLSDTSFKCNCCHRTFKAVNHLKCHLRYTHMKKSFKCRSCNTQFQFYKLYLAHMKNSKLCERCDKRICVKFDFKVHTQKCRGTAKLRNSTGNMDVSRMLTKNSTNSHSNSLLNHSNFVVPSAASSSMATVEIRDEDEEGEQPGDEEDDDDVIFDEHNSSIAVPQLHNSLLLSSLTGNGGAGHSQSLDDLMDTSEYPSLPHFLMDDLETAGHDDSTEEFKCEPCGKSFSRLTSLHIHSFQHDPNKEMKCIFCNFLFLQRSSLNRHYRCRNTLHTCQECRESFCSHLNMKQHVCVGRGGGGGGGGGVGASHVAMASGMTIGESSGGGNLSDEVLMLSDETGVKGGSSILANELRRERVRVRALVHTEGMNSEDVSGRDESIELSDTEPDSLTCMMCTSSFNTKADLDHHVATEHGTATKCTVCCKSFRSPTILHIHMAARANKKNKIECPHCPHRFNKQSEFRKHYLYHTMKANRPETSDEAIYSRIASKYPGK